MLGYDAGALNPEEAAYLEKAGAALPDRFTILGPQPKTEIVRVGALPVGIVFFPPSPDPRDVTPAALGDAVAGAALGLRDRVKLVIGISGWGMPDEETFLAAHPGALDLLLGSGPYAGTAGRPAPGGKTLWSRAYTQGKTVNRLDILALPGAPDFAWKQDANFKALIFSLDETYPADPAVGQLFQE